MPDPDHRWTVKFIEKAGGEERPVDLDRNAFDALCREYCPCFSGGFILKKVILILSMSPKLRRERARSEDLFPGFRIFKSGRFRLYFEANEDDRILTFGVKDRGKIRWEENH